MKIDTRASVNYIPWEIFSLLVVNGLPSRMEVRMRSECVRRFFFVETLLIPFFDVIFF